MTEQHPSFAGIPLVLGGNVFGWTADEDTSFAVLDAFYEAGGRMIDTAQGYSNWVPGHKGGESETVIGKWLSTRGVRGEMRIATKTGMAGNAGDLNAPKVTLELSKSLERLQTDYVDLYYAHRDDEATPQAEVALGFGQLVTDSLVRALGASNFSAERLASLNAASHSNGMPRFTVLQNEYNLVRRSAFDGPLQDYCVANGVAHYPFFGLAMGFLTGKYRKEADLNTTRGGGIRGFFQEGLKILPVMDTIAAETGASLAAIALAWIRMQPGIPAPVASARVPEQLDALVESASLQLSDDQVERLTAAIA